MTAKRIENRRVAHNKVDLTGKVFGKLIVIQDSGKRKSKRPIWECLCECGNTVEILSKYLLSGETQSCGCLMKGNAHNRTGFKQINGSVYGNIQRGAIKRGIQFAITPEYLYELYVNQNFKCALSGMDILIVDNYRDEYKLNTASLDRIDSSKGYVEGNVWWVHKVINIMKNKYSVDDFIKFCTFVVQNNNCPTSCKV